MSASVFKRSMSFLIDTIIIVAIVTFAYRIFAQQLIQNQISDFETLYPAFIEAQIERSNTIQALRDELDSGLITEAEYQSSVLTVDTFYNENFVAETEVFAQYILFNIIYFFSAYLIINYIYQLIFKGQTIGRKTLKIKITGSITWWNLLFREVFWKGLYWMFTFGFGIFLDFILIALTRDKKTIRDYITRSRVIEADSLYPI
jgi:hypothetical protein